MTFDFLIIAFSIFLFIKLITRLTAKRKAQAQAQAAATPPEPSAEVKLLTEIRDLLKAQEQSGSK